MRNIKPDLRILLFEITQKCNAKCDHCGSRCDINSEENLTKEEILGVFRDVKENIGTDCMINISGGEPLMRRDLFEIMEEASQMGFDWGMVTNGVLINDNVIAKMKKSGMKTITVSLDGLAETHESLRHLPGSFDIILKNLEKLKKADFLDVVQVTFTSNKKNYKDFPKLYEILDSIGVDSVRTSFIDPIGRAEDNKDLLLDRKEMQYLINFTNRINKMGRTSIVWGCCHFLNNKLDKRKFACFTGIWSASILYNGDIFVCPNVPRRPELIQGNIRKDKFSEVWKNKYEWFRNKPLPDKCKECKYRDRCDGDSVHTMDFDKNEPKFCYKDIFDIRKPEYLNYLERKYGKFRIISVDSEEPADDIFIEPEAYEDMRRIFHMGKKSPLSMYEQQVGLVGFKIDNDYVIKYVFPSETKVVAADLAIFKPGTVSHAEHETETIKKNFKFSDDRDDYICKGLRFLGFAHSHPVQKELCYSVGDEIIHRRLVKKYGDYIGILINPSDDLIGAYYGTKIKQGNLKIIREASDEKEDI